ncbi:Intron-binding protein aquarius [Balamuthia mandrillaris]
MSATQRTALHAPTVDQIVSDKLTQLSLNYWAPGAEDLRPFDPQIIERIYNEELHGFALDRIMLLELSHYLEHYLWPNFDPKSSSLVHALSILVMVNEKFREKVPSPWTVFHEDKAKFSAFFQRVLSLREESSERPLSMAEEQVYVLFFINCFQSLADEMVRNQCMRLVYLPLWVNVTPGKAEEEVKQLPERLQKRWKKIKRSKNIRQDQTSSFFPSQITSFLQTLSTITEPTTAETDKLRYCERFIEWMIDLVAQLPTRRFFHLLLEDSHLVSRCTLSLLFTSTKRGEVNSNGALFSQLVDRLKFYQGFEVHNFSGLPLTEEEITAKHCAGIQRLQRAAFKLFPEQLRPLALANIGSVDSRAVLHNHLSALDKEELRKLCEELHLLTPLSSSDTNNNEEQESKELLLEILIAQYEKRPSQLEAINQLPLYPNEEILWDDSLIPSPNYTGEQSLALPKLNLQFLTFHDYLLRNFNLFRLEATYELRGNIEDCIRRLKPSSSSSSAASSSAAVRRHLYNNNDNKDTTVFNGWARMALPVKKFGISYVKKPNLGEQKPADVHGEVQFTFGNNMPADMKEEWDSLKLHDIVYLITVRGSSTSIHRSSGAPLLSNAGSKNNKSNETDSSSFKQQYGIIYCRGAEVLQLVDEKGEEINKFLPPQMMKQKRATGPAGKMRTLKVRLDSAQYQLDMDRAESGENVYTTFNVIMRRKPKENNFKAILQTIRDLMNSDCVVPAWLNDVFLGYGDPSSASPLALLGERQATTLDYNDTFLDLDHVRRSFPSSTVTSDADNKAKGDITIKPPFRLAFKEQGGKEEIVVESYEPPKRGPYPQDQPKKNAIPFTPVQVQAITSAMQGTGLTLVVGPPGTGKTDVAVQIISNWYHNHPDQRTLLVTHSNQALNQLFEKIMELDVDERHLIRLGHGKHLLETSKDFGKYGRLDHMLALRLQNLQSVKRLAESIRAPGDYDWSCETAAHLFSLHVAPRWKLFKEKITNEASSSSPASIVSQHFPFHDFFADAPQQPLFAGASFAEDMETARGCMRHIKKIFQQLDECRPLELLRTGQDRANYLLMKQARIVAMTCTHAALKRHELAAMGFHYDNLLMEEAAQVLEIETFIPMLLQSPSTQKTCEKRIRQTKTSSDEGDGEAMEEQEDEEEAEQHPLKRVVLIGDHNQLPPVVQNQAFQRFANLDQSLFTRFVRLGVPTITLDAQGRCRPSLARLFNWQYPHLTDLPSVSSFSTSSHDIVAPPEFKLANPGFRFDYQLINVDEGEGEIQPSPFFYQNLAEAEYVVAVYMWMRLRGYPAEKITLLTSYKGQKHLLRDIVEQRCAYNPLFGRPHKVTTVDRFQGQQNDYILLSLVRTKTVGHIRDVRRLVVAMSRARLGLYVFGRQSLFQNCYELTKTFTFLGKRPSTLQLVKEKEVYPPSTITRTSDETTTDNVECISVLNLQHMQSIVYQEATQVAQHYAALTAATASAANGPGLLPLPSDADGASSSGEQQQAKDNTMELEKQAQESAKEQDEENKEEKQEADEEREEEEKEEPESNKKRKRAENEAENDVKESGGKENTVVTEEEKKEEGKKKLKREEKQEQEIGLDLENLDQYKMQELRAHCKKANVEVKATRKQELIDAILKHYGKQ